MACNLDDATTAHAFIFYEKVLLKIRFQEIVATSKSRRLEEIVIMIIIRTNSVYF